MAALFLFSLLVFNVCSSTAQLVPALYVFGDSTVDAGNNDYLETIVKANFAPYGRDFDGGRPTGRFCNGRLSTDYIASLIGLPYTPAYLDPEAKGTKIIKGVNFATSASGFFDGTASNFNVVGLSGQLKWFQEYKQKLIDLVGQTNASSILSDALYVLSTGSNDYINNYYINPLLQKEHNSDEYRSLLISSFKNFVLGLRHLGGRRIAVVSLSPLGCLPSQISLYGEGKVKCVDFPSKDAVLFNQALKATIHSLNAAYPGFKLAYIDLYTLFSDTIKDPSKHGFTQALTGCCGIGRLAVSILCNQLTPGTCSDASKYVFWDSFHPSDAMNKLIANTALVQGVPQLLT